MSYLDNTPVQYRSDKETLVCLRTIVSDKPNSLETYLKTGGYAQLKRIVTDKVKATEII